MQFLAATLACAALSSCLAATAAPVYTVTDLTKAGMSGSQAGGITQNGRVALVEIAADRVTPTVYTWIGGKFKPLPFPAAVAGYMGVGIAAISDSNHVSAYLSQGVLVSNINVPVTWDPDGTGHVLPLVHPFAGQNNHVTYINGIASTSNEFIGNDASAPEDGTGVAVTWDAVALTETLVALPAGVTFPNRASGYTAIRPMNRNGLAIVTATGTSAGSLVYYYDTSTHKVVGGTPNPACTAMNNSKNCLTSDGTNSFFVTSKGKKIEIPNVALTFLNDDNVAVGAAQCAPGVFVACGKYWSQADGLHDLNDLIAPTDPFKGKLSNWQDLAINNAGQIVVTAQLNGGFPYHAFLLQPQ